MIIKFLIMFISFFIIDIKMSISEEIQLIKIVAIVNDEPITETDLYERLQLTIISSNLPNNSITRQNLSGQILQSLINEKLQEQEAQKFNIRINEEEILNNIRFIEKKNNLNEGELVNSLFQNGVPKSALKKRLKANLINEKLLSRIITPKIIISEDEVENEYKNLLINEGKTEFKLSEILLQYNQISSKKEILKIAEELRKQILENNNFDTLANQMNINGTAKFIQNNNWIISGELNNDLLINLNKINKGEITNSIITNSGISIYRLEDKRVNSIPDLSQSVTNIGFISYNLPINMNKINEVITEIKKETQNISSCQEIDNIGKELGNKKGRIIGRTLISDLPNIFIENIKNLGISEISKPVVANDGIFIIMICNINKNLDQEFALKELVKRKIFNKSSRTLQNRYLLDLNRKALIDIRI